MMNKIETRRPVLQNDLYIRSEELSGTPAHTAATADEIEANADTLVRQLLIEEKRRIMPERLPDIAPQEEVLVFDALEYGEQRESARESIAQILKAERAAQMGETAEKKRWLRLPSLALPRLALPRPGLPKLSLPRLKRSAAEAAPAETRPAPEAASAETRQEALQDEPPKDTSRGGLKLPDWLRNYRPTRKHVTWAVIAALVLYRPLLVPLVVLVLFWIVLIAYMTLGPDRWGEILGGAWQRLHHSRPELAERVRLRADVFAEKFDRVLDWLPEVWAERLALPDFSVPSEEDEDRPDPFDRLAAEARQA